MTRSIARPTPLAAALVLSLTGALAACSSGPTAPSESSNAEAAAASTTSSEACPTAPVDVVVSVDQWGDIVSELGGACANVKTILAGSSVDPHDYEPSPADAASFAGAKMVVVNGADYDAWASKLAASSAAAAPVVSASEVTKTADGGNPHLWYSPSAVTAVADAVTAELSKLDPQAAGYFGDRRAGLTTTLKPYDDLIGRIKAGAAGKTYAATEGIFDYQAEAMGLVDKTPEGYQRASATESDPSPADIAAFTSILAGKQVDVLIYNTQTEGSIPEQIRTAAEQAGVPIVDVTETVPPGQTSFEAWQDGQLTALAKALGVSV
ncbi:metal ABC transporter solute-binding protein, Zn/Mn family [Mycolicibacterium sp. P1-18]|uniref:metal ABC transporter solute-binding protein, Zn/Mn family n=1 Tax=Mycolicibacterium sp. P1-18 TaxID=2024615 RepID=UPI001F5B5E9D|nr:zinc ABC transporter substrate-binding protein [Mycolicibacterium sp. P1-18]